VLAAVGDHRHGFFIVAGNDAEQRRAPIRLKCHPVADPKVEHLRVRAHLVQKSQPRHDPVVEIDQFILAKFIDVDFRDCFKFLDLIFVDLSYERFY
jgi:hypothetical protein